MADCSQYTPDGVDINIPDRFGLTERQKNALAFIRQYESVHDSIPTYQEMMEGLGLSSKSGIHRLVLALEQRGYIKRIPSCARAIKLVEPDAETDLESAVSLVISAATKDQGLRRRIVEALG